MVTLKKKKETITLAVVAARPPTIKKQSGRIIRIILDEFTGLFMRDIVIDRFQEIGSRLCASHLKRHQKIRSGLVLSREREKETHS